MQANFISFHSLSGSGYIVTRPLIDKLYNQTFETPFFWIDDIYITGLLVERLMSKNQTSTESSLHYDISGRYILSEKLLSDKLAQSHFMFAHVPNSLTMRRWFFEQLLQAESKFKKSEKSAEILSRISNNRYKSGDNNVLLRIADSVLEF